MDNSFKNLIEGAASVLILLPTNPSFDEVAAGLSLNLSLKGHKDVNVSCPTPMLVEYNRLVGINKINNEPGNKNLVIRFVGYPARDVERVSADIENNEFYLTVIPKPGAVSPKKEQVELTFSGVASDTIVMIGGGSDTDFPSLNSKDLLAAKLVHIGTKNLNLSSGKQVLSFARPSSSISEIVSNLIKELEIEFDPDIATNLISGIEEGCQSFKSPDVTPETFETFAELLKKGGQRISQTQYVPPTNYSTGPIPRDIEVEKEPEAPKEWLQQPKIFKGTSVS